MKFSILYGIILSVLVCLTYSCAGYTINGLRVDNFKKLSKKEKIQLGIGIGSAFAVHYLAHIGFYEINGIGWHQEWTTEVLDNYWTMDDNLRNWCGRIGTVTQLGIGAVLKYGPWSDKIRKHPIVTGFHIGNAVETIGYSLTTREGIQTVNYSGGNGDLEWTGYGLTSILLLMEKEK